MEKIKKYRHWHKNKKQEDALEALRQALYIQIRGFAVFLILLATVLIMVMSRIKTMEVILDGKTYEISTKEEVDALVDTNFRRGLTLKNPNDLERELTVPFSQIGVSYFSKEERERMDLYFSNKALWKMRTAFSFDRDINRLNPSAGVLYFEEEEVKQKILAQASEFSYPGEDAYVIEKAGKTEVISSHIGFEAKEEELAETMIEEMKRGNLDNIFAVGTVLAPAVREEDLLPYKVILGEASSGPILDTYSQRKLLYVFSALNNLIIRPDHTAFVSAGVKERMASLEGEDILNRKEKEIVDEIFEELAQELRKDRFPIESYNSSAVSVGKIAPEDEWSNVLEVSNNRNKSILLSCYMQEKSLKILVLTQPHQ